MTNYYRQGYSKEIVAYIKELISAPVSFPMVGGDPFVAPTFEEFAFSSKFKGQMFFEGVRNRLCHRND